ncbi:MAG: hypothetical protein OXD01_07645 [Gammaproteobacteria bacterium]|nr:hypothetical protein [Gammaproteobacteria bacterium]
MPEGKKGVGIMRADLNFHWKKVRGREPTRNWAQLAWYWKDTRFSGERINDAHLRNTENQNVRER